MTLNGEMNLKKKLIDTPSPEKPSKLEPSLNPERSTFRQLAFSTVSAACDNYHLTRKNDSYHLVIWNGHLWGGRFQVSL
jgi:hypothetical protein